MGSNIFINTLGIQDSGGITVLYKMLSECLTSRNKYFIVCNDNKNINQLMDMYKLVEQFTFIVVPAKGFLYRLYYENVQFRKVIKNNHIDLVYNFSGSSQLFLNVPQLLKIQNLLFYSKKIDSIYKKNNKISLWLKQIFFKRIVFKFMASNSMYFEVQSSHVQDYMSDFIGTEDKQFFVKSDIDVFDYLFMKPKEYDFTKKIKFLYIVGPHFEYMHKNFIDFSKMLLELETMKVDFEINITLTKEKLVSSHLWNNILNEKTNFLGYIESKEEMNKLFSNNTILISTSIIETLGLHIVEGIQNGVLPIVPSEQYSKAVYGKNIMTYELFNYKSLLNSVLSIINSNINYEGYILTLQEDLKTNENKKYQNILDIFEKVINVQK